MPLSHRVDEIGKAKLDKYRVYRDRSLGGFILDCSLNGVAGLGPGKVKLNRHEQYALHNGDVVAMKLNDFPNAQAVEKANQRCPIPGGQIPAHFPCEP